MGNGAYVKNDSDEFCSLENFKKCEKLARNGYYQENFEVYRQVVSRAITLDAIDFLEVLILEGNHKKLKPLHIACRLGRLESVELLCSAGLNTNVCDENGQTPLHICCLNSTDQSALCATFLLAKGKRALEVQDNEGHTPLHCAAKHNNITVLQVLANHCSNINLRNRHGQTALIVAQKSCSDDAALWLTEFAEYKSGYKKHSSTGSKNRKQQHQQQFKKESPADMERIMQVWERFFENAFKFAGGDDEDEDSLAFYAAGSKGASNTVFTRQHSSSSVESHKESATYSIKDDRKSAAADEPECNSLDDAAMEYLRWFDWTLLCEENVEEEAVAEKSYYAVHGDGQSRWLEEHVSLFSAQHGVFFDWRRGSAKERKVVVDRLMYKPLPVDLYQAVQDGWCTCYEREINVCRWFSIPTGCFEDCLPLGVSEDRALLAALNLTAVTGVDWDWEEETEVWFQCDQTCMMSWVVVVLSGDADAHWEQAESKEEEEYEIDYDYCSGKYRSAEQPHQGCALLYYLNTATNESSWNPPPNWALVTKDWGGWLLCCSEDDLAALYWYDQESGESVWVAANEEVVW